MLPALTVLVVDDDAAVRATIRRIVEREGHTVIEADHGRSALRAVEAVSVDLVITDIFMPEMDGIELISELRHTYPRVRVVAMSGGGILAARDVLRVARSLGVSSVLEKPFESDDVRAELAATAEATAPKIGLERHTG